MNSFSLAASRKQLSIVASESGKDLVNVTEHAELETRLVQDDPIHIIAGVSVPCFDDDISIDVEDD